MGNYHTRPIRFYQSTADFPLLVSLGRKSPSWGLDRWASCGLRFVPPDDEGFSLRGDNKRLVYRGRRRSHRFTILGNNAFEYDVILEREPASNIISLTMEGAENFDFFRQPDFLKEPLLAGSYAVYKKETLIGEGTGKLCHIHRPEIIDARGRRCRGELAVVDNELRITIPETFLSEAVYPVIVDPTIGTTTVGSQIKIANAGYDYDDYPWLENNIGLNKFAVTQGGAGLCTAYMYASYNSSTGNEAVNEIVPCIFTNENNKPHARKSRNENTIDVLVGYRYINNVKTSFTAGWRSGAFTLDGSLQAGTNIWFGGFSSMFTTRFDYGGECYRIWPDIDLYPEAEDLVPPPYLAFGPWDTLDNYKFSWYFTYTAAQSYTRTLTQGVTLIDNRKLTGTYKRNVTENVQGITTLARLAMFPRQCLMTAYNSMALKHFPMLIRSCLEQVRASMGIFENRGLARVLPETVQADSAAYRSQGFYRKAQEGVRGNDTLSVPVIFLRSLPETARISETTGHWGAFIRGLRFEAGSLAETSHGGAYYRAQTETVQAHGAVFRGLLIFVRLLTTSLVRDFLLRRFLKSNEELVLKSGICRGITLESAIH
jgi:hypothetical protein